MKKLFGAVSASVIAFMLVTQPVALMAQETSAQKACAQAQQDAQMEINKTLWLAIGFFGELLGIAAAYVIEPSPPASKLIGKSPEYVAAYTDCYKDAGKKIQAHAAIKGCVLSVLVYAVTYGCCILFNIGAAGAAAAGS